ncbi:MAG: magnesium transporter, partial [Pseudomonadales bacterium]
MSDRTQIQHQLQAMMRAFDEGTLAEMRHNIDVLAPQDLAHLVEGSPPRLRDVMWELIGQEQRANEVLQHLGDDVRTEFLQEMELEELVAAQEEFDTDDFADLLQQLPDAIARQVLTAMDARDRERLETVLSFPQDSAGGIMNTDAITVRARHSLELVLRYLRRHERLPEATDNLIVVNSVDEYVGVLPISRLLTTDPSVTVREVMDTTVDPITADMPDREVARRFAEEDLVSAPVVDDRRKLLGRITIDDVVDVIIEDADETMMGAAGLEPDEDIFAPVMRSTRRRAVWLGINLLTAFLAAFVINLFEETIAKVVALAVLMPIVASMGGVAGIQTLTLVVRGAALGHVGPANLWWLVNRELLVGILNGVLWAFLVAAAAAYAFADLTLGAIIAAAMIINMVVAACAGVLVPP